MKIAPHTGWMTWKIHFSFSKQCHHIAKAASFFLHFGMEKGNIHSGSQFGRKSNKTYINSIRQLDSTSPTKTYTWKLGWAKKSKFLIWAFLFAGHLQNGVRDPPKKFQIYRPINDRWQAIFVLGSVLMGKRPKNGQKMTIFKNGLKTHPKVVNASNQRWFHHFWGMLDL